MQWNSICHSFPNKYQAPIRIHIQINKNLMTIVTNFTDYLKKFATSLESGDFSKLPIFKYSSLQYFIEEVKIVVNSL